MSSSFRQPLVGKRFASATWEDGQKTEGAETDINFTASVQPLRPNELQALPEGKRESATFRLYTDFALRTTVRGSGGTSADRVQINGEWYEIIAVDVWQNNVINHYKAIARLIG